MPQYMGSPEAVFKVRVVQSLLWWMLLAALTGVFMLKLLNYWADPTAADGQTPRMTVEEGIIFGSLVQSIISTTRKFANLWVGIDPASNGNGHRK